MRQIAVSRRPGRGRAVVFGVAICLQCLLVGLLPATAAASLPNPPVQESSLFLPIVMGNYVPPQGRLCRFGVGAPPDIASYPVRDLRIGWYTDWGSALKPSRPGGIEYLQMVRLSQTGPNSYVSTPSGSDLAAMIAANPGAAWVIGNEPDRRSYQDSLEPQVYAAAYHDLYYQIKGMDPAARIVAGSIVQPTPLRLQYLDMVLDSYESQFGSEPEFEGRMPVDIWNIHAFILNEQSCSPSCPGSNDCWGAEIPPGISACKGNTYDVQDNDNIVVFRQFITNFRQWMATNGYQDRPLIITEFGVLMPKDFGFTSSRVNTYMNGTFDHLSTAAGQTGYGADKNRLVQAWAWYSLTDTSYNGWLFDAVTKKRTAFGDNFAAYTAKVTPTVNLTPVSVWIESDQTSTTLAASVANNGNIEIQATSVVRFYNGDPQNGGVQVGSDQLLPPLAGCARSAEVRTAWANPPSSATIWVVVDPQNAVAESDETDNQLSAPVVIPP